MIMVKRWQHYAWRHAWRSALAVTLALTASAMVNADYTLWAVLGALLAVQTSRGTPARQGLSILLMTLLAVTAGFVLRQFLLPLELSISVMAVAALCCSVCLMQRQPLSYQSTLPWIVPAIVLIIATIWAPVDEMILAQHIICILAGGTLGILCSVLVLPVVPYWEFRQGLAPILQALIHYSKTLEENLELRNAQHAAIDQSRLKIESIMRSGVNEYPEWVFEPGFNRNLRASFRYILVQLDRITDGFFSLDYHARQEMDAELLAEVTPHLIAVLSKNRELLSIMRAFFIGIPIENSHEDFTSDIIALNNTLRNVLPGSVELLDISPDYMNISALARDVIDLRELLLQVVAALPIDDIAVTE
jgi:hypothetical protein